MPRHPLTQRQHQVFSYIERYIGEHGYSPSYEEIQAELRVKSVSSVYDYVDVLTEKGWVRKAFNRPRSLELVPEGEEVAETPTGAPDERYVPVSALPSMFASWLRRRGLAEDYASVPTEVLREAAD